MLETTIFPPCWFRQPILESQGCATLEQSGHHPCPRDPLTRADDTGNFISGMPLQSHTSQLPVKSITPPDKGNILLWYESFLSTELTLHSPWHWVEQETPARKPRLELSGHFSWTVPAFWSSSLDLHGWERKYLDIHNFFPSKRAFSLPATSTFSCILILILQYFTQGPPPWFLEESLTSLSRKRHLLCWDQKTMSQHHHFPDAPIPNYLHTCWGPCAGQKALFDVDSPPVHTFPPTDFSSAVPIKILTLQELPWMGFIFAKVTQWAKSKEY